MPEEKIGTKVELDISELLKRLDQLNAATRKQKESWDNWLGAVERRYSTLDKVSEAIKANTNRLNELRFSEQKATTVVREEIAVRRKLLAALNQLKAAHKSTESAVKKHTRATGRNLKKMLLWGIGAASAYRLYMKLRRAAEEFVRQVIEGTEEETQLTAVNKQLRAAVAAAFGPEILDLVTRFTGALEKLTAATTKYAVQMEISRRVREAAITLTETQIQLTARQQRLQAQGIQIQENAIAVAGRHAQMLLAQGVSAAAVVKTHAELSESLLDEESALDAVNKRMEEFLAKAEEQKSATSDLVSLSQKWTGALTTHAEKQQEVTDQYTTNVQVIQAQYYQKLFNVDRKYNKAVGKINADALKSREKAYANYAKQLAAAQRRVRLAERNDAARHALEMEFARRRYNLSRLQNERMYQYQRGMLVAEGDVLAIEDLDARYELERQAQEENFKLQMEQAEAMYRLQQRIQRETNREQMAMLRAALNEQLQAIEEARRERLDEAKATHVEEKAEAGTWAGEQMADEYTRQQKLLEQNDEYLENMRKKTAEGLVKIAQEYGLSEEQIAQIAREGFGADGEIVRLIGEGLRAQELLASQFEAIWTRAARNVRLSLAQVAAALAAVRMPPGGIPTGGSGGYGRRGRTRQYGGKDIVTKPTWFLAGERNQPERVTVQPLSPIGGALTLGWRGGPIPLQGQGLEGADLSGLGDSITQGIMAEVRGSILGYRGQRGS